MTGKKTATGKVAAKAVEAKAAKSEEAVVSADAPVKAKRGRKCVVKNADYINAESVGFRAGDVYQALAAAGTTLTVQEIAKAAGITEKEVYLGLGWLFKEGKVKGENVADISLA
ncbi:MAG: winged helix-turn-helix domain-containing protein [Prevotella sp.]|nr:winged helix-turn-helix domain-containing protein [Prevotella sp.]